MTYMFGDDSIWESWKKKKKKSIRERSSYFFYAHIIYSPNFLIMFIIELKYRFNGLIT